MSADTLTLFSSAQAVTGASATVQSTNLIDMKVAQDLGGGRGAVVESIVTTTFVGGTSVTFQLCAVDSGGGSPVVLDTTRPYLIAELVKAAAGSGNGGGTIIELRMRPQTTLPASTLTHLCVQYVLNGTVTAGAVTTQLVPEAQSDLPAKAYPSAY